MNNPKVDFPNLTEDQLSAIKTFEKEFNSKYGNKFLIMAIGNKVKEL